MVGERANLPSPSRAARPSVHVLDLNYVSLIDAALLEKGCLLWSAFSKEPLQGYKGRAARRAVPYSLGALQFTAQTQGSRYLSVTGYGTDFVTFLNS